MTGGAKTGAAFLFFFFPVDLLLLYREELAAPFDEDALVVADWREADLEDARPLDCLAPVSAAAFA